MARRARPNGQQLFSRFPFYAVQEHQRKQLATAIDQEDPEVIRTGDIDALMNDFAERFAVEAPRLLEGAISVDVEEAEVDVTGDFRFGAFDDEPVHVAGIRAEYYVPYEGGEEMFQCSASARNLSMRPIELRKQELVFTYERPDQDVAATKAEFDRELAQVRESLGWLAQDCKTFNASLPAHARELIAARRKRLEEMTTQIQGLGVTIRKAATMAPAAARTAAPAGRARNGPRKVEQYDIALSFAERTARTSKKSRPGCKLRASRSFTTRLSPPTSGARISSTTSPRSTRTARATSSCSSPKSTSKKHGRRTNASTRRDALSSPKKSTSSPHGSTTPPSQE
jgi:hypothetical protein